MRTASITGPIFRTSASDAKSYSQPATQHQGAKIPTWESSCLCPGAWRQNRFYQLSAFQRSGRDIGDKSGGWDKSVVSRNMGRFEYFCRVFFTPCGVQHLNSAPRNPEEGRPPAKRRHNQIQGIASLWVGLFWKFLFSFSVVLFVFVFAL